MAENGGTAGSFEALLKEIRSLHASVGRVESLLTHGSTPSGRAVAERPSLLAHIQREASSTRFPFRVHLSGVIDFEVAMSPVRVAILAVLLKDLQDRTSGGPGLTNKQQLIRDFVTRLGQQVTIGAVTTALYRFDADFITKLPLIDGSRLKYDPTTVAVSLHQHGAVVTHMIVDVTSPLPLLDQLLQELLPTSPLAQARSRKVLYVPGGPTGFDRLFLELFDHRYSMREESLFFKPSIITYPDTLLNFIQASREDRQRRAAALRGFQDRRCYFREILNRNTLLDLIRHTRQGKFLLYPPTVTQRHVEEHLGELIRMSKEYPDYTLTLTDAPLPFLLSLFEIESGHQSEGYTVFFRQLIQEHDPDINCFLINDPAILAAVRTNVISAILANPTTTDDRQIVDQELRSILKRLQNHGPIRMDH